MTAEPRKTFKQRAAPLDDAAESEASTPQHNDRPHVLVMVQARLENHRRAHSTLPACMPQLVELAAPWVIDYLFQSKGPDDSAKLIRGRDGADHWTPTYLRRVMYCLNRFLALSAEDQQFIVSAREDGAYWHGDDMNIFRRMALEIIDYKAMGDDEKAAYRAAAVGKARTLTLRTECAKHDV